MNRKDKEIMVECFDYDRDGLIGEKDLESMMDRVVGLREEKKKNPVKVAATRMTEKRKTEEKK